MTIGIYKIIPGSKRSIKGTMFEAGFLLWLLSKQFRISRNSMCSAYLSLSASFPSNLVYSQMTGQTCRACKLFKSTNCFTSLLMLYDLKNRLNDFSVAVIIWYPDLVIRFWKQMVLPPPFKADKKYHSLEAGTLKLWSSVIT